MLDRRVCVLFCTLRLHMLLRFYVARRGSAFVLQHGVLNCVCVLLLSACAVEAMLQHLQHQDVSDEYASNED